MKIDRNIYTINQELLQKSFHNFSVPYWFANASHSRCREPKCNHRAREKRTEKQYTSEIWDLSKLGAARSGLGYEFPYLECLPDGSDESWLLKPGILHCIAKVGGKTEEEQRKFCFHTFSWQFPRFREVLRRVDKHLLGVAALICGRIFFWAWKHE